MNRRKERAFCDFSCDKTGNVRIMEHVGRVRATIVAVEKQ